MSDAAGRFGTLKQVAIAAGGVDPRTAKKHLDRAGILPDAMDCYEVETAAAEVLSRVSPAHLLGHAAAQRGDLDPSRFAFAAHLTNSKRDLDDIKVARAQLALDRERKLLVGAEDVEEAARTLVAKVRHHVMEAPRRIAARIATEGATTKAEFFAIADDENRRALAAVADIGAIIDEMIG